MIDQKKDDIQNEAVDVWIDKECKGTLNLATGSGKTFCFFKAILKRCKVGDKILFLAETRQREIDLFIDLEKFEKIFGVNLRQYNIQFDCYQSAYKWLGTSWDLVCADEIHNALTPEYSKFFFNNHYKMLLGLSATVDRTTKYLDENGNEYTKGILVDEIAPVVFKYSLNDSIKNNTSKKLVIYLIDHWLDNTNKNITAGTKDKPFLVTEKDSYDYWDAQFKAALFISDHTAKTFRIRNAAAARAKVLYIAPSKIIAVNELLKHISGKTIVFGNNIDALNQITKNTISSKNSEIKNASLRKQFDEGKIKIIGSFKMLKQGANLAHLDNTVLHSYYSKELDFIQMLGRQRNSEQIGNVFIIKTVNTVEVKWYNKAMENINDYEIIKCINIEDCIKKYKESNTIAEIAK